MFMFKTRPLHVTRSAPVVGTSQNVGAVNGDDDDGKRDCGGVMDMVAAEEIARLAVMWVKAKETVKVIQ